MGPSTAPVSTSTGKSASYSVPSQQPDMDTAMQAAVADSSQELQVMCGLSGVTSTGPQCLMASCVRQGLALGHPHTCFQSPRGILPTSDPQQFSSQSYQHQQLRSSSS